MALYDIYAERDGATPRLMASAQTLATGAALADDDANWPEGYDAVAIPVSARLAAGLYAELPGGSLIYESDWQPVY